MKEVDAIWASAVYAYRNDEPSALSIEQEEQVYKENVNYMSTLLGGARLNCGCVNLRTALNMSPLIYLTEAVGKPIERQTRSDQMQVASILRELGYVKRKMRVNGALKWVYKQDSEQVA